MLNKLFVILLVCFQAFPASKKVINSDVKVSTSTASSSSSTGALVVSGGAGIGGACYVGGSANLLAGGSLDGTFSGTPTWSGLQTYTGANAFKAGAVGSPSWYLGGDTTTGPYQFATNRIGWAFAGVLGINWNYSDYQFNRASTSGNGGLSLGITNSVNAGDTANNAALNLITTASGGDPYVYFATNDEMSMGLDNNDGDTFKLTDGGSGPSTGTTLFSVTQAGIATFPVQLIGKGTATNDSAAAGYIGQYIESIGGSVALTSNTWADATSLSITAGDWDCFGTVALDPNTATTNSFATGISTTSGNSAAGLTASVNRTDFQYATQATNQTGFNQVSNYRVSLASTTTHYLKFIVSFAVGSASITSSRLSCRRMR